MLSTLEGHSSTEAASVFAPVDEALSDLRRGSLLIVADSHDHESWGDLIVAAERCTPEVVNFMVTEATGIVFLCLPAERVEELGLRPMAPRGDDRSWKQAMTVSIEARHGVTTGISARDRAHTIQVAIDPRSPPRDLVHPGHVFPLAAQANGVLGRPGRTEACVDLARLAGFVPAGVAAEIVAENGAVGRLADLVRFARRCDVHIVTVDDVVRYRWRTERVLEPGERTLIRTRCGEFSAVPFEEPLGGARHLALVQGALEEPGIVRVSVHLECFVGDALGSTECACGTALERSLGQLASAERGVLVYVRSTAPDDLQCGACEANHAVAVAAQVLAALDVGVERTIAADRLTADVLKRTA